ncbi:hypothetical protein ACHQM5_012989 [Ranunculus cassubicifolius]
MSGNINSVFYAESYHPIQSGSIDGTDILPHDNAVYRAHLCASARLYDPFGDPKVSGDPYCTLFVGHLNHLTTEQTLHKNMSKYGTVKNLRLVRHIGGGIGGKKESGQLRFGGRERPFRAPLRPIPYDELKKLGIPAPPEGRYMTQLEVPPPPRRPRRSVDRDERPGSHKRHKHTSSSRQSSHRHEGERSTRKEDHLSD